MTTTPVPPVDDADRILIVDDDPTNIDVLRHTLDGLGCRLFMTRSGESALDVARRVQPLLILLDIVMPGIDGYETCKRLKEDPKTREAAVIFLSSLDETKDKVRGLQAGAVDFVSKPFQRDEVIARVNTHLTLQRLRRQIEARNEELTRELAVAQELLTDARRRVEGPLLGDSPAIRALRESIARYAADTDLVLLTGPEGAGHEAAARAIHHASGRGQHAFFHVNCAMLAPGQDPGIASPPRGSSEVSGGPGLTLLQIRRAARCISNRSIGSRRICRSGLPRSSKAPRRRANTARRLSLTCASSSTVPCRSQRRGASIRGCCRCCNAGSCVFRRSPSGRRMLRRSRGSSCSSTRGGSAPWSRRSPISR